MREILGFIRWCFSGLELWQWAFITAMILQLLSFLATKTLGLWLSGTGLAIILAFISKWVFWDGVRSAWGRYRKERNSLLDTIKHSD
jgi:hypothetical protein